MFKKIKLWWWLRKLNAWNDRWGRGSYQDLNQRRKSLAAVQALGELRDVCAVEPLIKALGKWMEKDAEAATTASGALMKLGSCAVEPLIKALWDGNPDVRYAAAMELRKLGDARAVEPLIKALDDEYGDVCHAAALALGKLGDKRAVEPLIKALGCRRCPATIILPLDDN